MHFSYSAQSAIVLTECTNDNDTSATFPELNRISDKHAWSCELIVPISMVRIAGTPSAPDYTPRARNLCVFVISTAQIYRKFGNFDT